MISGYRLMWLFVMFDLPVLTKENRRDYRHFVEHLEDDGFIRVQYSVYARPCATDENTNVHLNRVVDTIPPDGEVRVLKFTDRQWGRMMNFRQAVLVPVEAPPEQFAFFDDALEPLADEGSNPEVEFKLRLVASEPTPKPLPRRVESVKKVVETKKPYGKKSKRGQNETPTFDFFDGENF